MMTQLMTSKTWRWENVGIQPQKRTA